MRCAPQLKWSAKQKKRGTGERVLAGLASAISNQCIKKGRARRGGGAPVGRRVRETGARGRGSPLPPTGACARPFGIKKKGEKRSAEKLWEKSHSVRVGEGVWGGVLLL